MGQTWSSKLSHENCEKLGRVSRADQEGLEEENEDTANVKNKQVDDFKTS